MVLAHNIEDGERTQDVQISEGITFGSMLLSSNTLLGLQNSGFYKPSPIQLHGIPLGKCGFDLLLEAKSGTGKTAVFTVIALEQLNIRKGLQTIILAPTREIAAQICDVIKQIGSHYDGLKVEVVMGGLPVHEDIAKFRLNEVHVVVGSPGRLRHLIQDKHIDVSSVRLLVLDEADKLLEKSFLPDINFIYSILSQEKQVILSSATYPAGTKSIIKQYVQSAQHVCPDSNCILVGITQKLTVVKFNSNIVLQTKSRFEELLKILSKHAFKQCLIFCNYQARVAEVYKLLQKHKWPAEQLYGQQEQLERLDSLRSLQEYKCRILISTDLAARGIDASNVDLIINFEPPYEWQTYLHRIGRAGRFGSYGMAITILSKGKEEQNFREILNTIKLPIKLTKLWEEEDQTVIVDRVETSSTMKVSQPSSEDIVPVDIKTTEKCEMLWNLLTEDQETVVEDFEQLYISFNTVQEQIQCFSDILSSFESYQSTVDETVNLYKHLEIMSIPIPAFKSNMTADSHKGNNQTKNTNYNNLEINNNTNSIFTGITNESNLKDKQKSTYYSKECSEYDGNKNVTKPFHYEFENANSLEAALINAGLPTAFGKPKLTKREVKYSKYDTCITSYQNNDVCYQDKRKQSRKHSSKCEDFYQNKGVHDKIKNSFSKSQNKLSHTHDENQAGSKYASESSEESYHQTDSNYINWYKNLKFRTREVEFAIYIQELSKLHQ